MSASSIEVTQRRSHKLCCQCSSLRSLDLPRDRHAYGKLVQGLNGSEPAQGHSPGVSRRMTTALMFGSFDALINWLHITVLAISCTEQQAKHPSWFILLCHSKAWSTAVTAQGIACCSNQGSIIIWCCRQRVWHNTLRSARASSSGREAYGGPLKFCGRPLSRHNLTSGHYERNDWLLGSFLVLLLVAEQGSEVLP